MNVIEKLVFVFCVAFVGVGATAGTTAVPKSHEGEIESTANEQAAILDTIAQINHINWVWNTIKTYNNSIVLAEEYDKISPGNLNLNRIPDDDILKHITDMLDTLHSLRMDEREIRHWRQNFNDSRSLKLKTYYLKASRNAVETLTAQARGLTWDSGLAAVAQTAWNIAHFCASLHNDYANFVYELDNEMVEKNFSFDTGKMEILHKQNKALLQAQWQLIRRYHLDDRLRVSDNDIRMLLGALKNDAPSRIYTRLVPMSERFCLFPEYWYYLSGVAMETGHIKEGLDACDTFFKVNRGIFRDDPMEGAVAFNKAFMLPKTDANKQEIRRCLELAWKNNVIRGDWQMGYLTALMYKGVFNEQQTAETMLEQAISLIEDAINDRRQNGAQAGLTLGEGLRNCRNALHQLRGEPLDSKNEMEASLIQTQNVLIDEESSSFDVAGITNAWVSFSLPNDNHIHDWSKFSLQLLSRGTVLACVAATATDCVVNTNGCIVLKFNTTFIPTRRGVDEYCLAYNNPECPVKWRFRSLWYYFSDKEMNDFYEEILEIYRSKGLLVRFGIWLMSDDERNKLKTSFIEATCLQAFPLSVSINGSDLLYTHSLHSLWKIQPEGAESNDENYEIVVKHVRQLCTRLKGRMYMELDEFMPYIKQVFKESWCDMVRDLK